LHTTLPSTLQTLRRALPEAAQTLKLDLGEAFKHWIQTVDRKLLPRMDPDYPLTVVICGGGSAGKSTLFNQLVGQPLSPVGGQAGLNRRVLLAAHASGFGASGYAQQLSHVFGDPPEQLAHPDQLLEPGTPLYCTSSLLPAKVVLLDTPDIDTGAQGVYTNRDMARQAMEVADLFIYVFTNATYNNRDNTDFIARMLTGVGTRPCYLVYRVYPSFTDAQVQAHAHTVAENIYGPHGTDHVLGLFRMDEDNAVAAGEQPPALKTIVGGHQGLITTLTDLDTQALRAQLLGSMTTEAVAQARQTARTIQHAVNDLARYTEALIQVQATAVQQVLSHFPTDRVLRRFARIWMQTDPPHIKWMRTTGRIMGWPVKTAAKTLRRLGTPDKARPAVLTEQALGHQMEMDLLSAANQLYQKSLATHLDLNGVQVALPALLGPAQQRLGRQPWQAALESLLSQKDQVLSWSLQLDADLTRLARDLRARMSMLDQIRQTFAALLNVIPTTAAITYILHTGDPFGATGIKIKLTGLLGLNDLYALVAIPASAGISKADQRQLEFLLQPLAHTWLAHKCSVVQQLFETHITGNVLETAQAAQARLATLMAQIEDALTSVQG
jgi:hypothetical protein